MIAVEDLKEFHKQNMATNYRDYTYMARFTHGKAVTFFQTKGARVHFNFTTLLLPESNQSIKIRYGIVELEDLLRDLKTWETLLPSTFMQRPHTVLKLDQDVESQVISA